MPQFPQGKAKRLWEDTLGGTLAAGSTGDRGIIVLLPQHRGQAARAHQEQFGSTILVMMGDYCVMVLREA